MHHGSSTRVRLGALALPLVLAFSVLGCQTTDPAKESVGRGRPLLRNKPVVVAGPTITVKVPSAQSHFEAGLRAYYEGERDSSGQFFQTATELDPGCAMCFWGVALAASPTPGAPDDPAKAAKAAAAIDRAQKLEPIITAPERGHIEAMVLRVTVAGGPDAASRQRAYARAMQALASQYPGDLDAVTLAAEASLQAPGAVTAPGKGVAAGPADSGDALQALRGVLAEDPAHPGASRLYNQTLRRSLLTKWQDAMMAGQEAQAMAAANEIEKALTDDALRSDPDLQGVAPAKVFTLARFGHWKEILQVPPPRHDLDYHVGMWYYARGLAFTRLAQFLDVPPEQAGLEEAADRVPADETVLGNTNARKVLQIAILVLNAEIEHMRAHRENSLKEIQAAVVLEDSLPATKPSAWYVPTRQVYGAILLWNEKPREAEAAFRQDLERNPENGWSLLGLSQSLQAQKRLPEAAEAKARSQHAFASADVKPPTSVF